MNSAALENTNTHQHDDGEQKNMRGDDSNLVDEILTELNQDNPVSNNPVEDTSSAPLDMSHHSMHENDMMDMTPDIEIPPQMDVEYDSTENSNNSYMKKLKKPLVVMILCFIIFNPSLRGLLTTHLPRVFGEASTVLVRQGQSLLLASVVALLFFATNLLD